MAVPRCLARSRRAVRCCAPRRCRSHRARPWRRKRRRSGTQRAGAARRRSAQGRRGRPRRQLQPRSPRARTQCCGGLLSPDERAQRVPASAAPCGLVAARQRQSRRERCARAPRDRCGSRPLRPERGLAACAAERARAVTASRPTRRVREGGGRHRHARARADRDHNASGGRAHAARACAPRRARRVARTRPGGTNLKIRAQSPTIGNVRLFIGRPEDLLLLPAIN